MNAKKMTSLTSFEIDLELRRRIDDLRLARARGAQGTPPSMRSIVLEAVTEYLDRELVRFTP
jgi:predicted transcriptional regulator